jgi:hypothetical protein
MCTVERQTAHVASKTQERRRSPRGAFELNPYERELGPEEFEAKSARALADEADRASIRELIAWFRRR